MGSLRGVRGGGTGPDRQDRAAAPHEVVRVLPGCRIETSAHNYVESSQGGDPEALVQMAVFRMQPWGRTACRRGPTAAQETSYRRWIQNLTTGIEYARGFALDSTHYTGPSENIRHGKKIVDILRRDGYGTKHFILDTAKSGRSTTWLDMIPSTPGGLRGDARTCATPEMTRCVTLGIPPTAQAWSPEWGLPAADRRVAEELVDGFVWFGRPWLYMQADPFVTQRAVDMGRTTPWPGPTVY